jgi:membrane-associated phospholipid phosphatase
MIVTRRRALCSSTFAHGILAGIGAILAAVWAGSACAEPAGRQVEPDAGRWRTWAIVSGSATDVPAPPDAAATVAEIQDLKNQMGQSTVLRERVDYWGRGWPGYRWQEIALAESQKDQKPLLWRTMALVSVAINDATIATWHQKYKYSRARPSESDPTLGPLVIVPQSPSYPSEHAAVAAAAADILAYIFPNSATALRQQSEEAAQSRIAAGANYPSDVKAGLTLGHQVGAAVIARAKADHSDLPWDGKIATGPNLWAGTNPRLPTMGTWTPWVLSSPDQFRPPPPPSPTSPQMASDLAEVKTFQRTPLTRRISYFWAVVPELREWIAVTNQKIFEYRIADNPPRAARAMALVMIASIDSFIGCFEAKYHYLAPRPFQVDPTVDMLFPAPNHPSYPAAHGCGDGAAEVVLSYLFPQDAGYFRERAEDGAMSRLWAGIHFRSDIDAGLTLGRSVGQLVVTRAKEDDN